MRHLETVSLSTPIADEGLTLEDLFEDPYPATDENCVALTHFLEGLPEKHRRLLLYKAEGLSQRQFAKIFGRSQTWVSRTLSGLQEIYLKQEDQNE